MVNPYQSPQESEGPKRSGWRELLRKILGTGSHHVSENLNQPEPTDFSSARLPSLDQRKHGTSMVHELEHRIKAIDPKDYRHFVTAFTAFEMWKYGFEAAGDLLTKLESCVDWKKTPHGLHELFDLASRWETKDQVRDLRDLWKRSYFVPEEGKLGLNVWKAQDPQATIPKGSRFTLELRTASHSPELTDSYPIVRLEFRPKGESWQVALKKSRLDEACMPKTLLEQGVVYVVGRPNRLGDGTIADTEPKTDIPITVPKSFDAERHIPRAALRIVTTEKGLQIFDCMSRLPMVLEGSTPDMTFRYVYLPTLAPHMAVQSFLGPILVGGLSGRFSMKE